MSIIKKKTIAVEVPVHIGLKKLCKTHKKDMMIEKPTLARKKFLYRLSRSDYERDWGKDYIKPGFGVRILAGLLRFMPKIGPFKALAFDNPTPEMEELYFKSINTTVDQYRAFLATTRTDSQIAPNRDLDDGNMTKPGEYSLADEAYAKLLAQLSKGKFDRTTAELRADILRFYSNLTIPFETKRDKARWKRLLTELDQLKAFIPAPAPANAAN